MWVEMNSLNEDERQLANIDNYSSISIGNIANTFDILLNIHGIGETTLAVYDTVEEANKAFEMLITAIHEGRNFFKMPE